jgi:hypothetical protein
LFETQSPFDLNSTEFSPGRLCFSRLSPDFSRRVNSEGQQAQVNENRDELKRSISCRSNSLGKIKI